MSDDNKTWTRTPAASPGKPSAALQIIPGTVLKSTYRIEEELGSGGMGTVFRATHLGLDKRMAVKVLSPRAVASPESLARFEREAKVAGKVSHPAMTHVIVFGLEQGTPYIVMEYVDGLELAQLIDRHGALPPRQAVAVMRQLISLLRAAHALGIVHRDLKPANIKVIEESADTGQLFVKVLDFGIAKVLGDLAGQLTSEGMMVGTPAYMAPEQIAGKPIDGRTDLYAAGLIFHEMLSGSRAYQGETIARILHAQMTELPPPLALPLPDVVHQTLRKFYEKRPEDRFQDAGEADRALVACEEALRGVLPSVSSTFVRQPPPDTGRFPAPAAEGLSATMQRPEAGAVAPPPPANPVGAAEGLSATMRRPEAGAVAPPPPANPAPLSPSLITGGRQPPAIVTDRQPAPVLPTPPAPPAPSPQVAQGPSAPPMAPRAPPAPARAPPARSSSTAKGCLVAVLAVGGLGVMTCFGGILWASQSDAFQKALEEGKAAREQQRHDRAARREHAARHDDAPSDPAEEMMAAGMMAAGCYALELEFESTREDGDQYGPWEISEERSRKPVRCDSVRVKAPTSEEQQLLVDWPDEVKVLRMQTLSTQNRNPGDPDTRRKVVLVYTHVMGGTP